MKTLDMKYDNRSLYYDEDKGLRFKRNYTSSK